MVEAKKLSVSVPQELLYAAQLVSGEESPSAVIRQALQVFVSVKAQPDQVEEIARRAGQRAEDEIRRLLQGLQKVWA